MKDQCRVEKEKSQAYSITQVSEKNRARLEYEASERFQERMKLRHRIEEKNGELKEAHGLRRADSTGLFVMQLQMQKGSQSYLSPLHNRKDIFLCFRIKRVYPIYRNRVEAEKNPVSMGK